EAISDSLIGGDAWINQSSGDEISDECTSHSSTVTLDGVAYQSLQQHWSNAAGGCSYAAAAAGSAGSGPPITAGGPVPVPAVSGVPPVPVPPVSGVPPVP